MLVFLKALFLDLQISYYTSITFLMKLCVIFLSMPGAGCGLLISVLGKLRSFGLIDLTTLVLLM